MTGKLIVTLTDQATQQVVAEFGPCTEAEADDWARQVQDHHPDVDLVPTLKRIGGDQ